MKPGNILLLGATYATGNLGVWTLASGAVASARHSYPQAQIDFLDYNVDPQEYQARYAGGVATVRLFNIRFSKKFWLPNHIGRLLLTALFLRLIPAKGLRKKIVSRNVWLQKIGEADLVGSIAGGDSFSDIYGIGRLIYVALPQILVLLSGKPLALLPQTYGPFQSPLAKGMARFILEDPSASTRGTRKAWRPSGPSLKGGALRRSSVTTWDLFWSPSWRIKKFPNGFAKSKRPSP